MTVDRFRFRPGHPAPIRPIVRLVRARLRNRAGERLLAVAAVAAAAALVLGLAGISTVSGEQALRVRMADMTPGERAVRVVRFADSNRDRGAIEAQAADALAATTEFTEPAVRGLLYRRVHAPGVGFDVQVVAVDDPAAWTDVLDGRLPAPCDGQACEAVLLSRTVPDPAIPATILVGDLRVSVVGRADLASDLPLGPLDTSGPRIPEDDFFGIDQNTPAALLLVSGVDAASDAAGLDTISRTTFWTAALRPDAIHAWTTGRLGADLAVAATRLSPKPGGHTVSSPLGVLDRELARVAGGATRLIALGSLAVAVLLAFATFAGLMARSDVGLETGRLRRVGATGLQRATFLLLEPILVAVAGGVAGFVLGLVAIAALAVTVDLPPDGVVGAVLTPAAIQPLLLVIGGGAAGLAIASAPGFRPGPIARTAAVALVAVLAVLGWQLAATPGATSAGGALSLARGPILVVLPALVSFAVALVLLLVLPVVLRALAARSSALPLPSRLALLSVARDPGRPAATVTLLTLSVGLIAFAAGYGATVDRGTADQSAFLTGMDVRVTEGPSALTATATVLPFERYAELPDGAEAWPVTRLQATAVGARPLSLIGVQPEALAELRGWRSDFGPIEPADLATALTLEGDWAMAGQPLDPSAERLDVDLEATGAPLRVTGFVQAPDGEVARVDLGVMRTGRQVLTGPLLPAARGGSLVGLAFSTDQLIAGEYHQGDLNRTDVVVHGAPGLTSEDPIPIELARVQHILVRAPQATDDLVLPALVSQDIAVQASRSGDGTVLLTTGDANVRIRPVAVATAFPTVEDPARGFVVADLAPLQLAVDAGSPGLGRANEAWIRTPDAATTRAVEAALAAAPFRFAQLEVRDRIVQAREADPVSKALVWGILAAALAGLALSILGLAMEIAATLRDERGEVADLEAQGLTPAQLRRQLLARALGLAGAGTIAGLMAGIVVTSLATGALALTADAARPVPTLLVIVPWPLLLALAAGVALTVLALVLGLTARADGRNAAWAAGRSG